MIINDPIKTLYPLWLFVVLLIQPVNGLGASALEKRPLEEGLDRELNYLLSFVGPQTVDAGTFSPERISQIIEFILKSKDQAVIYHAAKIDGAASAYHEVDINDPVVIVKAWQTVQNLPDKDLSQIAGDYLVKLEKRTTANGLRLEDKKTAALFVDQQYLTTLDREEMKAFVILEYMKQVLNDSDNQSPLHQAVALDAAGETKQ